MGAKTNISWADSSANAVIGCTKISEGCAACWAANDTPARVLRHRGIETWGPKGVRHEIKGFEKTMLAFNRRPWICNLCGYAMTEQQSKGYRGCPNPINPAPGLQREAGRFVHLCAHHRRRVFVEDSGDWLDERWPIETFVKFLDVIRRCPDITIQLLTKRPENWRERCDQARCAYCADGSTAQWEQFYPMREMIRKWVEEDNAPPNIWIGVSVENQQRADERIPQLLAIPAAVRFLSCEPLLGQIDLARCCADEAMGVYYNALTGKNWSETPLAAIHWVIAGNESKGKGVGRLPPIKDIAEASQAWMHYAGVCRSLMHQCKAAGVAFHNKQMPINGKTSHDMNEWPEDLRVREFPNV